MRVVRSCTADEVVETISALVAVRGAPVHLRMDNGPEMIAWALHATTAASPAPAPPTSNPAHRGRTLRGVVQQLRPRRALQRRRVRYPARSLGHRGGLAHRVQHLTAALLAGRSHPSRVCSHLDRHHQTKTLIASGPVHGVPSGCAANFGPIVLADTRYQRRSVHRNAVSSPCPQIGSSDPGTRQS